MIRIAFPSPGLTPTININDSGLVSISSGTMTESITESNGYTWYEYSFTGTPGAEYQIEIDGGNTLIDPEVRYVNEWVTEELVSYGPTAIEVANEVRLELAIELSRLDDTISSRMATFNYTAPDNAGVSSIKSKTDNLPTDPASNTQVNTRLATEGYTAPDNSGITAIKGKTDQLVFSSGNLNAVAKAVEDKTGYALTSGERTAIAIAVESAILNESDGQAILNAIIGAIGNTNIDQIALVGAIRADIERVGGSLKAIPTNPLLTNDTRLDHIDADISSRSIPSDVSIQLTTAVNAKIPVSIIV